MKEFGKNPLELEKNLSFYDYDDIEYRRIRDISGKLLNDSMPLEIIKNGLRIV